MTGHLLHFPHSNTWIAILIVLVFIISCCRNSCAFALCCEDIAQWHAILNPVVNFL